ncbi:MAG TPA: fumarate hydratase [Fibrobacteraceae bacterium]|nr:fumarate hydratase [Fibrobacteraceae bacterium]
MAFQYEKVLQYGEDTTEYIKLSSDGISVGEFDGQKVLKVTQEALTLLTRTAMEEIGFKLRPAHLEKLRKILLDSEASANDKFVARNMLENQVIAAQGQLPTCQDTGTATVIGKKGQQVWTGFDDTEAITKGVYEAYQERNLRYSQVAPLTMLQEKNTGTNLPAQIDLYAEEGMEYKFLFMAKGGGSANKTQLFPMTQSLLKEAELEKFLLNQVKHLGTAACPPYHLALVIGGTSADFNMKLVKMASAGYLDHLPTSGNEFGRVFRDLEWEEKVLKMAQDSGIGAQFGGKYFVHDVRVIRAPRHAASCPVGIAVSCSADRNLKAKITADGIFIEKLEKNPARFLEGLDAVDIAPPVKINLDRPMDEIRKELSKYPIKTRLSLSGTMIVARDIAHSRLWEMLQKTGKLPDYFKNHPVYYAGPAKTPQGLPTGSFGPTTANRMDPYVDEFQKNGYSMVMVAKGNRSKAVTDACKKYGGFYLGSIGGPAAILAKNNITSNEVLDFPELGMEAVRKITIKDFPAFILVDDKGNDFFEGLV